MHPILKFFSSLRLTVVLLSLSLVLIFFGTLDQVEFGIWETQKRYFESFLVVWSYPLSAPAGDALQWIKLPMPGGYLIGGMLLINLLAAHATRFKLTWKKSGLFCIHIGLILLLISELLTDIVSVESQMSVDEGSKSNYSETILDNEFVLIDRSNPQLDRVHAIPSSLLKKGKRIKIPDTELSLKTLDYFPNASLNRAPQDAPDTSPKKPQIANKGLVERIDLQVTPLAPQYAEDAINTATAYIQIIDKNEKALGTWLVSNVIDERFPPQILAAGNKSYEIALRFKRYYHPFQIELIDFKHDKYPGTEIPFNFSSEVYIKDPKGAVKQKALIYMNHPLRYGGLTFYQASFANNDQTSIFQVVKNPGWLLPYISVLLMGLGMCFQFGMHFIKFLQKSRTR